MFSTLSFAATPDRSCGSSIAIGVLLFLLRDELTRVVVVGPRGAAGAGRGQLAAAARHLVAVPARDVRRARRRPGRDPREQPPAPDHGAAVDPARRAALLRVPVRPPARRPRRRADRGSGQRQRRGAGAVGRGDARRRRGDRPRAAAAGTRPAPGASVSGPARERAHRRRPGVPGADARPIRPDPVRAARLADAGVGAGRAAAGELPVHDGGDADGARPPAARRRVLDVQLLPPRRVRALRRDPRAGVRPRAVHRSRRAGRRSPAPSRC